jgi:hypothetical protein
VDGKPVASMVVGLGARLETMLPHSFRLGTWQRIALDVRIAGASGPGTVAMSVAGDAPTEAAVTRAPPAGTDRTRVLLGVHRYLPNAGGPMFEATYDDVVVRFLADRAQP